jgi:hypothetical protein
MNLRGFVDSATPERISGWAMDQNDPDLALSIEFALDGRVIATVLANEMRVDLRRADIGTGAYGFSVQFPTAISLAELQRIFISAVGADGERARIARFMAPGRFAPQDVDNTARPVFVLGSRRSGTSVVAHALMLKTRYVGPHEGHVMDLLAPLGAVVEKFYMLKGDVARNAQGATMLRDVPRSYFDDALSGLFQDIASKFFSTPFWMDKTPTPQMIRSAPRLAAIWPHARFIFMRRRGFENLLSHGRKFPAETFQAHCSWWADCMAAWLEVRHNLAGRAIEIDQYLLARDPALAAGLIGDLLSLEPQERRDVAGFLTARRVEQTGAAVDGVEHGMPEAWDAAQRQIFTETCLPLFAPFHYAEDSRYFLSMEENVAWARI